MAHVLDAHRAWSNQLQGVDIDALEIALLACGRGRGADALTVEELGGDALGVVFECRGAARRQGKLAGKHLLNAPAQHGPLLWSHVEVPPEIEQIALTHL